MFQSDNKLTSANATGTGPYIIDNLTEGHGYTFVVKSVSSTGKRSPQSNEVKYTFGELCPHVLYLQTVLFIIIISYSVFCCSDSKLVKVSNWLVLFFKFIINILTVLICKTDLIYSNLW